MKLLALALLASVAFAGPPAPVSPELARDFEARDDEGRWVLVMSNSRLTWAETLVRTKAHTVHEWLALTRLDPDWHLTLPTDAPGWFRTFAWLVETSDSHTGGSASSALQDRGTLLLGWLARFPSANIGKVKKIAADLRAEGVKAEDAKAFLGPYDAGLLLAGLRPPAEVVEFAERKKAEPGVTYVHQVKRSIDILTRSNLRDEPWPGRLTALDRHAHPGVRQAACLGWSHWKAREVPVERLLAIADNVDEDPLVREAALLGLSYSDHPRVHAELHRIATIPGHAAWRAAITRVVDNGDTFSHAWLMGIQVKGPEAEVLDAEISRLESRLKPEYITDEAAMVPRRLAIAAWAELHKTQTSVALLEWTKDKLSVEVTDPKVREALRTASTAKGEDPWGTRDRAAAIAREVLGDREPAKKEPE